MADRCSMDDAFIKVILIGIGPIRLESPDFGLDGFLGDFDKKIREETIT